MSQHTRDVISNILFGVSLLCVVTFVVQHFMTSPRPSWHRDLAFLGLAFVSAAEAVRGRRRRRMQD